tara:strand:+ start:906 stop:1976 length:1071 start_codon:yes stop_codon:yes gene_type:complete
MKKTFFYTFGITLSLIVSLILCEIFSRLIFGGVFRNDPVLKRNSENGLIYQANLKSRFISFEWDVAININSLGFRDLEKIYNNEKEKVLVLGDSCTEGFGLALDKTFPKQLEKLLNQNNLNYNVLNAGISGNNLVDYLEIYNRYFKDDSNIKIIIIALYVGNDLIDNYAIRKIDLIEQNNISFIIKNFAARHSTFYNITNRFVKSNIQLRSVLTKLGFVHVRSNILSNYDPENKLLLQKIKYSTNLIGDFKKKLNNKKLYVALIPSKEQINDDYWKLLNQVIDSNKKLERDFPTNTVENDLNKQKINTINLYKTFNSKKSGKNLLYFKYDPHPNENGNNLMALEIFEKLYVDLKKN